MTETMFDAMAEMLKTDISKEIAYDYVVFVSSDTKRVISEMKRNIYLSDRKFLGQDLQKSVGNNLIFPYDVLNLSLEKHIANFYGEFQLSQKTSKKLAAYGNRGQEFEKAFNEQLNQSRETLVNAVKREMNLQMMQSKDAKSAIDHIQKVLEKRLSYLKNFLKSSAGQLEQYMVLWDYQDKGYTHYRLKANGDNCEDCSSLDGKIFPIYQAESGINLAPIHPNCDCSLEVLDENGNAVVASERPVEDEKNKDSLDYLQASLRQVILGNYTDDVNLLGTLGQVALGLLGWDLLGDVRDIFYDITNFENTPEHKLQTLLDAVSLLPLIGGVKYIDEAGDVLKSAAKHGDDAAGVVTKSTNKLPWNSWQTYEKVNQNGQTYAKIGNRLYSEHAVNRMQPSGNRFGPNIYQGLKGKDYGRSISPQYVEEVINSTKAIFQPETGNFVHALGTVKVIVNSDGAVVTIITYR